MLLSRRLSWSWLQGTTGNAYTKLGSTAVFEMLIVCPGKAWDSLRPVRLCLRIPVIRLCWWVQLRLIVYSMPRYKKGSSCWIDFAFCPLTLTFEELGLKVLSWIFAIGSCMSCPMKDACDLCLTSRDLSAAQSEYLVNLSA